MPDISQTIRINDEFSEPLKELTKASYSASTAIDSTVQALSEQVSEMKESNVKMLAASDFTRGLVASSKDLRKTIADYTKNTVVPFIRHTAYQIVQAKDLMKLDWQRLNVSEEIAKAQFKVNNELTKARWATEDFASATKNKLNVAMDDATKKAKALKEQLPEFAKTAKLMAGYVGYRAEWFATQTAPKFIKGGGFGKILPSIGGFFGGIKEGYGDKFPELMKAGREGFTRFTSEFKRNMEFMVASQGVSAKHMLSSIKSGFSSALKETKKFGQKAASIASKAGKTAGGVFGGAFGRMTMYLGVDFVGNMMNKIGHIMLNKTKSVMLGVRDAIGRSLDDISMTEKLNAMWGDTKGGFAKEHAYRLANELGESAQMVTGLASKAAYEGIGTSTFERAMKLSDKIAALRPGETTENVASSLLENLKSGHSAGSMAQMLGGGQVMERQLKRSGFEQALRKGDMQKALSIAEKIAEQAGLTEDKYKKANEGLAQDFQRVNNIIDNIKQKLGEIYSNQLASIVKRVREFLESDKFKKIMAYVEWGVKKVGSLVAGFVHSMLDNLHIIGILLAGSFVIKIFMVARAISSIPMLFKAASTGAGLLAKAINFVGKMTGIQFLKMFSWSKLLSGGIRGIGAAIKAAFFAHPVVIILGAVGMLAYQIAKATGFVKSFGGAFLGVIRLVSNAINNLQIKVAKLLNTLHTDEEEEAARVKMNAVKEEMTGSGTKLHFLKQQRANARRKGLSKSEIAELDKQIKEIETGNKTLQERFDKAEAEYKAAKEKAELSKKTIEESLTKQEKGWTEGVAEAFKMSNDEAFGEIKKKIDKMLGIGADIRDSLPQNSWLRSAIDKTERWAKGIADNSNKIKDLMSQEEELRWLKAFSDRQIMSNYTYQTSTTRNVTISGASQAAVDSAAFINTRGRATRPRGTGA